ncbi:prepilin-type N-terminal cleavage/methylation domain-containing protein [Paraburkholderia sp. MMS20-SJTR3]|uniref:Prepilin-type N-terminal cleavage/methylation domain-containing protein n=1 Tax=Paraburkholderia sejongensis TaxID=2886946 RepID=A0ABS8JQ53_9BURK|nr:prepilin-type N-terminal cleavage/methylation domain-containing protein [Paraburkholderia sp. MMS20-SJTR3]MCC8391884.1 prepilin-type N-terminal cleavage/methylation domain-containing protein [Paraburkholderia sp. MMS20-SJTR3]
MKPVSLTPRWRAGAPVCGGNSLIEVMVAVALIAVTALGLLAGQLWTAREARAMALREQAAWIADAVTEAFATSATGDAALGQWRARAAVLLPRGEASIVGSGAVTSVRVTWASVRDRPADGEVIDKPESCGGVETPAGFSCVALAFAR